MKINETVSIAKREDSYYVVTIDGRTEYFDIGANSLVDELYSRCRSTSEVMRQTIYDDIVSRGLAFTTENVEEVVAKEECLTQGLSALIDFFSEFAFEPNFRFVNTLAFKVAESQASAKSYIENYFALMDNSYQREIKEKMKSKEFNSILSNIAKGGKPTSEVNKRFKIYYGSAGTGKTTLAMKESDMRCIICNASMLPSDLMEDFIFVDGKATFTPSKLWRCMEEGLPIVLDEINLLPFDSLRFLQGILDGKSEFDYKGNKVVIKDGFEVIGTMNLSIGGMTYGLPEPLVDRSADMKKFSLTADMLSHAILG